MLRILKCNGYIEFNKLKSLLEPFRQNLIYKRLGAYQGAPNPETFKYFMMALETDFAVLEIPKQVKSFSDAHNRFFAARVDHQATIDAQLQKFTDSFMPAVIKELERVSLK